MTHGSVGAVVLGGGAFLGEIHNGSLKRLSTLGCVEVWYSIVGVDIWLDICFLPFFGVIFLGYVCVGVSVVLSGLLVGWFLCLVTRVFRVLCCVFVYCLFRCLVSCCLGGWLGYVEALCSFVCCVLGNEHCGVVLIAVVGFTFG